MKNLTKILSMVLAASALTAMMMTTAFAAPSTTCPKAKAATTTLSTADLQSQLNKLLSSGTLGTCPKSADIQALLSKLKSANASKSTCPTAAAAKDAAIKALQGK